MEDGKGVMEDGKRVMEDGKGETVACKGENGKRETVACKVEDGKRETVACKVEDGGAEVCEAVAGGACKALQACEVAGTLADTVSTARMMSSRCHLSCLHPNSYQSTREKNSLYFWIRIFLLSLLLNFFKRKIQDCNE